LFGQPDPLPEAAGDNDDRREDNEFPEADIDQMRAQRDIALQRYIQVTLRVGCVPWLTHTVQEAERKDAMFAKLNAVSGGRSDANQDNDDDVAVAAPVEAKSRRK
jgi:hypothetical protein